LHCGGYIPKLTLSGGGGTLYNLPFVLEEVNIVRNSPVNATKQVMQITTTSEIGLFKPLMDDDACRTGATAAATYQDGEARDLSE
jgi:hypothetical protein